MLGLRLLAMCRRIPFAMSQTPTWTIAVLLLLGGNATSVLLPLLFEQFVHLFDKIGRLSKNGSGNTVFRASGQSGNTLPFVKKCD